MKHLLTLTFLSIFGLSFAQIPSYVPSNGLVGWWPFNGNANDESGNGNNGTVNGATLTSDRNGVPNSAYSLNNLSDVISVSNCSPQFNNTSQTISLWMKFNIQYNYSSLALIKNGTSYINGFNFFIDQNNTAYGNNNYMVGILLGNGNSVTFISNQTELGQWVNLVSTYDGASIRIYLNGILKGTAPYSGSLNCPNNNVVFGQWDNPTPPNSFNRNLDDIGIWNRALTQSEITNLYNSVNTPAPTVSITPTSSTICGGSSTTLTASTSGSTACASSGLPTNLQTGLVGYWPFCGNANDASGNGNNGTVNGATLTTDRFGNSGSAYSFDGVNDVMLLPANVGSFSASFWFRYSTLSSQFSELFFYEDCSMSIVQNGSNLYLRKQNQIIQSVELSTSAIPNNQWVHIVVFYNNSLNTLKCTINGTQVFNSNFATGGLPNLINDNQFHIGARNFNSTNYLSGSIDDFALYNRELSASEIQQLYTISNATYSWSPGGATTPSITVSPSTTTTYSCTATVNGQSTTASSVVTVNPLPTVNAGVDFTKTCVNNPNGSTIGMAPAVGVTYSWAPTNGLSSANSSNPVANPSSSTTYTLTATNAVSGCSNTDQVLVVVNSTAPVANAGLDVNVNCTGSNGASIGSTAIAGIVYSWSPSIGLSSSSVSNPIANPSSTTAYTLTATNTSNGCTANDAVLVTVGSGVPISAVSLTVNDQPCGSPSVAGSMNVTLTGGVSPITYTWTRNGLNFNALPANAPTNLIAGNYTVTVTDGCGTTMTSNSVTLSNAISIDLLSASGSNALCFGGNGTISASIFGGTSQRSLVVTNTVTNQVYTQVVPYGPPVAGVYPFSTTVPPGTYSVTAVDPGSTCPSETWLSNITITQPVNALTATTVKTDVCFGASNGTITVTATGGTPSYTYSKDGGITFQSSNIFSGLTAGTYTIVVRDANNCSTTPSSVTITQSASALSVLVSNVTNVFCNGSNNGSINITTSGGTTPYSYAWTGPNSFTATTEDLTGRPAGTYNVVVTDAAGCTQTATATITQPTVLNTTSVISNVLCNGASTGAINVTSTGGLPPYTYSWTGPNSFTATTEDIAGIPAGTYVVLVVDANACANQVNYLISQPTLISATATHTNVSCFGLSNGTLVVTASGGVAPYTYSINGTTFQASNIFTGLAAGTYTVYTKDANNCVVTTTKTITQPSAITLANVVTNVSCTGGTNGAINLTVTGGTTPYTYAWTGPNSFTATTEDLTGRPAGTYTVIVTDANGCTATATLIINTAATNPTVNAGNDAIKTCIQNINGAQIGESAQAGLTYQWTPTTGLSSSTIANPIANPATTTTYTLTATNAGGCTSTDQVVVTVDTTAPTVNAGLDITSCQGSSITLNAISNASSLSWTNGIQNNIPFTANIAGITTYTVTATAVNGCTATDAANVTVIATPTANPIPDYVYCSGSQTLPVVFSGTNATSYSWTNSLTSIGLAATGIGNISSFTAMNTTLFPINATISVTPINTMNSVACIGAPETFFIVVNPTPIITSVPNINICNGSATTPVVFTGTGTSYQWTNSNASIGMPSSGIGNIPSFIGVNTSNTSNTATIIVSPQYTNGNLTCVGAPTQFQITVHPTPIALPVQDMVVCCQAATNQINFATSIPGVTVNWAAYASSPLMTGYPTSGTGNIPSFSPTNLSLNTEYIWFNYTPTSAQGCVGMTDTLTIGVLPCSVFVDTVMDVAQCAGSALNAITFTGNATSFSWVNTNPNNGIAFSGVDGIPATTLLNSTQSINISQILITPNFTDMGLSCVGPIVSFEVAVYPLPVVSAGPDQTICDGGTVILSGTGASTYSWTGGVQDGVGFMPNMTGQFAVQGLDSNGCQSAWDSVMVFINYPTNSNLNISACDTYDLNGQLYTQSGLFTQVIPNSVGCDSTITLDLTLDYSPTTPVITISNGVNLSTSAQTGATYQWIRCSDQTPISGATALTFNPTVNGTYAVVVTNNCGSDTSDCSTVSTIGIDDISFAHIQLYPNPNNGSFKLVIPEHLLGEEISILDMSGRLMKKLSADQLEQQIQIDNISTGTYWIVVKAQKPIQFTIQ